LSEQFRLQKFIQLKKTQSFFICKSNLLVFVIQQQTAVTQNRKRQSEKSLRSTIIFGTQKATISTLIFLNLIAWRQHQVQATNCKRNVLIGITGNAVAIRNSQDVGNGCVNVGREHKLGVVSEYGNCARLEGGKFSGAYPIF
jgi:hypothetical protein